jgi:hypothetical protein
MRRYTIRTTIYFLLKHSSSTIMKKRNNSIALLATLIILLAGCYPQGPEDIDDMDVVVTYFQDDYNFSSKQTYARPDRIVKITGNLQDGDDPDYIPDATAGLIINQIDNNMSALGWELVDVDEDPDVLLTLASWETNTIVYYYDYWYWWWGGYYPGFLYYRHIAHGYNRSIGYRSQRKTYSAMGRRHQWYTHQEL